MSHTKVRAMLLKDLGAVRRGQLERGDRTERLDHVMAEIRRSPEDAAPLEYVRMLMEADLAHFAQMILTGAYHKMVEAASQPQPTELPEHAA